MDNYHRYILRSTFCTEGILLHTIFCNRFHFVNYFCTTLVSLSIIGISVKVVYFDFICGVICFFLTSFSMTPCDFDVIPFLFVYIRVGKSLYRLKRCQNRLVYSILELFNSFIY